MGLGERLAVLADAVDGKDAAESRRASQLLALSLALDPVNQRARKLLRQFKRGDHAANRAENADDARKWIQATRGWLASDVAGTDGHALAACLADVLANEGDADGAAETGAWAAWVADLSKFQDVPKPEPVAAVVAEVVEKPRIQLDSASVAVPLWRIVEKSEPPQWQLALSTLVMSGKWQATEDSSKQRFSLVIGNPEVNPRPTAVVGPLLQLLRATHGDLPRGVRVKISSPELDAAEPTKKRQRFSAAAAVLASAALTGIEPTGTIIGQVDASGEFTLPADYWEQVRSLAPNEALRLILPAAAEEDLPSLLVTGEPAFFMNHEVLLARDFKQLLELSAKQPVGSVGQATTSFRAIQGQAKGRQLGSFVASPNVRRALTELAQTAPFHASARILAIQGAGDRPSYITRRVLLAELRIALEPMQWLVDHGQTGFTPAQQKKIGQTFETCRSAVEQLRRYSEKGDHSAIDQTLEMLASIRALDRASRTRSDTEKGQMSSLESGSYSAFLRARKQLSKKLDPASGQAEE